MTDVSTYILIDRKLTEWRWYKNGNTFRVFLHLLIKANSKDGAFENRIVHRGEHITSLEHLAEETGLTVMEVRTALDHLKETGEITSESTNKYTVINIVNYDVYQNYETYNNKQLNKRRTNNQQSNNNQLTTNNTVNTVNTDNTVKENTFSLREIEELRNQ